MSSDNDMTFSHAAVPSNHVSDPAVFCAVHQFFGSSHIRCVVVVYFTRYVSN